MGRPSIARYLAFGLFLVGMSCGEDGLARAWQDNTLAKHGDLHELAKKMGGRYAVTEPSLDGFIDYSDLKSIVRASKVVVVGSPVDNVCDLSENGRSISTNYTVRVERSLKGKFREGDQLTVALRGGRYTFEDGSVAQVNVTGFHKMLNGNRYMLFLVPDSPTGTKYVLTGGSRGLFELAADGTVHTSSRDGIHGLAKFAGTKHNEFIDGIDKAIEAEVTSEQP